MMLLARSSVRIAERALVRVSVGKSSVINHCSVNEMAFFETIDVSEGCE